MKMVTQTNVADFTLLKRRILVIALLVTASLKQNKFNINVYSQTISWKLLFPNFASKRHILKKKSKLLGKKPLIPLKSEKAVLNFPTISHV